ncbi:acyltransferase [Bizionia gelidisalsuginis]|uniref:Acyltransferase n=1 Tax=Bizionia gelidisalsuginis TaxID=291188 RepID=A0ABY3M7A9_9FLAO|nr:acyltransferase [Bizionia gelidisalsuginis]TYC08802.1 acyltransferase [Bizionia gelidisalsuginis]
MHSIINYINEMIFRFLPETRFFKFKQILCQIAGLELGDNIKICSSVRFLGQGKIKIGSNTWIGPATMIISTAEVKIGENVDIAPRVYIGTGTHEMGTDGIRMAGKGTKKSVIVGDGTWIGTGAIILPGVTIGRMCIIAAGSLVNKDINDNTIVGGVPAKVIKNLLTNA